jgi:hypothetical protein
MKRKASVHRAPVSDELTSEISRLQAKLRAYELGWPPGHFYSPIPALDQVKLRESSVWAAPGKAIPGVDLREDAQLELFERIASHYPMQPWDDHKKAGVRYYFHNDNYSYGESLVHLGIMKEFRPKRIIEIGSGFSSCVSLDTNELFLNNSAEISFIEPYPELLYSLIEQRDRERVKIYPNNLQDVDPSVFEQLQANDILFVDSTHVSKVDSDVNHILFNILPRLNKGVIIHFHDICYPFEYPKAWVYQGRAWNEAYILRAFLQYNDRFSIIMFNSFIGWFHGEMLAEKTPLIGRNAGSSIWLIKN